MTAPLWSRARAAQYVDEEGSFKARCLLSRQITWGCYTSTLKVVLTKKSVLIETVEFAKPQCVACESHVYPFRLPALLRASLFPKSGSSAS